MSYLRINLVPGIAMLFISMAAMGQSINERKQDLIREMLKEKMHHAYYNTTNNPKSKLTKTSGFDQRISTTSLGVMEGEVSLAVNPSDSNKLVLSYMEESSAGLKFPVYYSSNGGQTWTKSTFSTLNQLGLDFPGQSLDGGGDPAFAWDKNGKVYFAWIYLTINASQDTLFFTLNWASSTNNGVTWTVAAGANHFIGQGAIDAINSNTLNYFDGITDREWLAVDNTNGPNQGNLYCSFVNFPAGSAPTVEAIKVKTPAATSFGPMVAAYTGSSQFGNVEVDKNGVLHMSCADVDNNQMIHLASSNGGGSFSNPVILANGTNYFPQQQQNVIQTRENAAPNLATDGAGNLHIVWSDYPGGVVNSYYSRSTDGGNTWASRMIDSFFSFKFTVMPTVAASGNKITISVTAYGDSTDINPDSSNFYQIVSMDNGQTFSKPVKVSSFLTNYTQYASNANDFFGDYFRSVALGCNVYAAWSDGRLNLGPKIYFSKTNACSFVDSSATGIRELTNVNSNIKLESIFPNPANSVVNLSISGAASEDIMVELADISGKNVMKQKYTLHAGTQHISLPLNGLKAGVYILSVMDNSVLVATRQLVVN